MLPTTESPQSHNVIAKPITDPISMSQMIRKSYAEIDTQISNRSTHRCEPRLTK